MREWYVRMRAWTDFDEPEDDTSDLWQLVMADGESATPEQYHGEPDDVLRQIEDELRPTIEPDATVTHHPDRLVISLYNHAMDGTLYREFELVDPLERLRMPVGLVPLDRSGLMPNRFLAEFQDVASSVKIDLELSIADADPLVGRLVARLFLDALGAPEGPDTQLQRSMSLMLWLFMMGRDHAVRGYLPPPVIGSFAGDVIAEVLEPRAPGSAAAEWDALDDAASAFGVQFREVAEDALLDYRHTLGDLDAEVGRTVSQFVLTLLRVSDTGPEQVVHGLLSAARWMFLLGRAHAEAGHQAPVPRGNPDLDLDGL